MVAVMSAFQSRRSIIMSVKFILAAYISGEQSLYFTSVSLFSLRSLLKVVCEVTVEVKCSRKATFHVCGE